MITLTTPVQVATTLGTSTKTGYDRLDITTINYDVVNKNISGQCLLLCSAIPTLAGLQGTFSIPTTAAAILTFSIPGLQFVTSFSLTTAQQAAVQGWITAAQNTLESGLVSVGVVAGVQSAGS